MPSMGHGDERGREWGGRRVGVVVLAQGGVLRVQCRRIDGCAHGIDDVEERGPVWIEGDVIRRCVQRRWRRKWRRVLLASRDFG